MLILLVEYMFPYNSLYDQISSYPFDRDFQTLQAGIVYSSLIHWPKKFLLGTLLKMMGKYHIDTLSQVYVPM